MSADLSMERPALTSVDANMNRPQRPRAQLALSTTSSDKDAIIVNDLAFAIYSALKKLRQRSISKKILVKLIKAHLKLRSSSKAKLYLNELVRLKYIIVPTFASETHSAYTFSMEARLSFSRVSQ